jgi:hypothetical protein
MTNEQFREKYKAKLKIYFAKLTSQQIEEKATRGWFPFFGSHEETCLE